MKKPSRVHCFENSMGGVLLASLASTCPLLSRGSRTVGRTPKRPTWAGRYWMIMIIVVENKQAFTDDIMLALISLQFNLYSFYKLLTVVGCGALAFVLLLKRPWREGSLQLRVVPRDPLYIMMKHFYLDSIGLFKWRKGIWIILLEWKWFE